MSLETGVDTHTHTHTLLGGVWTSPVQDGEEPRSAIVSGVTLESPGTVHTHQDRRHGFQDGDSVVFKEVQGMTQLNDGKPRQIKVTGRECREESRGSDVQKFLGFCRKLM